MTNTDKIIKCLADNGNQPLCDDCLSSLTKIEPRQAVNQICNKLRLKGRIKRRQSACSSCSDIKLVNTVGDFQPTETFRTSGTTNPGAAFEGTVKAFSKRLVGIELKYSFSVEVGVGEQKKAHKFDLGNDNPPIMVECKAHKWTESGNVPSFEIVINLNGKRRRKMTDKRIKSLWKKGVQLMGEQYT